jgi:hypothetical protein
MSDYDLAQKCNQPLVIPGERSQRELVHKVHLSIHPISDDSRMGLGRAQLPQICATLGTKEFQQQGAAGEST